MSSCLVCFSLFLVCFSLLVHMPNGLLCACLSRDLLGETPPPPKKTWKLPPRIFGHVKLPRNTSGAACMLILPFEPSHFLQNFGRHTVKHIRKLKWLPPVTAPNSFSAGPGPRWSLQRSPKPPSWLKGTYFLERGEEGRKERKGKGGERCANEPSHFSERSDASDLKCTTGD